MDMESMISHVTKNVMGMMQNENFMKSMEATTKELVKSRITQNKKLEQEKIISPFRKKALIELSKGTNSQDKAWALRNIAILMLNGITFDGIQIKTENGVKN